jgi:hypothetical protein
MRPRRQVSAPEDIPSTQSAFVAGFIRTDNALDLVRTDDDMLVAAAASTPTDASALSQRRRALPRYPGGRSTSSFSTACVGDLCRRARYRVHADGTDVWVNASERYAEGTAACVASRAALLPGA